jgi:cyclopropane fatty-acyl-phospholipid synthase-like methyltransferase
MSEQFHVPSDWYETFFTAPVNKFWEKMVPPEATAADISFLRRHLRIEPPARILDLPCGSGRHSLGLAATGFRVTGVDLSKDAIARAGLAARKAGLPVDFVQCDMRGFVAQAPFDAAICMGNSLGYFGADGLRAFLRRLAGNVLEGGRLVLDSHCCAESVLPLQHEREIAFDGGSYASRFCYDAFTSTLNTEAELRLGDETHSLLYAHHVTSGELVRALGEAGFAAEAIYADTEDTPFRPGSPRLLLVATKA